MSAEDKSEVTIAIPRYFQQAVRGHCCAIIAHAGGAIDGNVYTNSIEGEEANYALGTRMFELDFQKTADGHWVSTHDWPLWTRVSGFTGETPPDLQVFSELQLNDSKKKRVVSNHYSPVSLQWISGFLSEHDDAVVVTDVKELEYMPEFTTAVLSLSEHKQFVFQAYSIENIEMIYEKDSAARIILTLYRMGRLSGLIKSIIDHREKLQGITIPMDWAYDVDFLSALTGIGLPVYLHGSANSINSRALQLTLATGV